MDENQLKAVLTKYFGEKTGNVTRETSKDELKTQELMTRYITELRKNDPVHSKSYWPVS